jgi:hypothetical protein
MATVEVRMADGWLGNLREAEAVFLDERLGPDMVADMHRAVPVLTGRLDASLDHQVVYEEGAAPVLQAGSFEDDEGPVEYDLAVEFGFAGPELVREHVVHRGFKDGDIAVGYVVREHVREANTPEQPYMRPALYRTRY